MSHDILTYASTSSTTWRRGAGVESGALRAGGFGQGEGIHEDHRGALLRRMAMFEENAGFQQDGEKGGFKLGKWGKCWI